MYERTKIDVVDFVLSTTFRIKRFAAARRSDLPSRCSLKPLSLGILSTPQHRRCTREDDAREKTKGIASQHCWCAARVFKQFALDVMNGHFRLSPHTTYHGSCNSEIFKKNYWNGEEDDLPKEGICQKEEDDWKY